MPNDGVVRYKPLGWAVWFYGPIATIGGALLLLSWWNEIVHTVANSGIVVHSLSDWFSAVLCPGSRCTSFELAFSGVMWGLFFAFGAAFLLLGLFTMNVDRSTKVDSGKVVTWRGNFIRWYKESFSRGDIAQIDVAKVPVFMVMGNRVSKIGEKWRVTVVLRAKGMFGKPKKRIVALEWKEADARAVAGRLSV